MSVAVTLLNCTSCRKTDFRRDWFVSHSVIVRAKEYLTNYTSVSGIQTDPKGNKLHTVFYNIFLLQLAILVPEINISRTTTLEFQDFSGVFQDLCPFSGLSRPGNLNILIPGLSRVCMNPALTNGGGVIKKLANQVVSLAFSNWYRPKTSMVVAVASDTNAEVQP